MAPDLSPSPDRTLGDAPEPRRTEAPRDPVRSSLDAGFRAAFGDSGAAVSNAFEARAALDGRAVTAGRLVRDPAAFGATVQNFAVLEALGTALATGPLPEGVSPEARLEAPEDARLSIRGNTITIESNIHLYGSGATPEVAALFERQIQADWGQNPATGQPWTFTDHLTGREYQVRFDIDVDLYNPSHPERGPGLFSGKNDPFNRDNYIEVIDLAEATRRGDPNAFRPNVQGGDEGTWDGFGRAGINLTTDHTASHEFGHLLGFEDRYVDVLSAGVVIRSDPQPGWAGNIMAQLSGRVQQRNIDALVGSYVEQTRNASPGETRRFEINDSVMRR